MIICLFILWDKQLTRSGTTSPLKGCLTRLCSSVKQSPNSIRELLQSPHSTYKHGRLTISRSVKYSRDWKDERPLSWKRQQCEPSLPQPLHPADGIKRNDETEHQSFVFLTLNHQPVCVFLCPGTPHTSTGPQNQPLNPGILGTQLSSPEMQTF